MSSKRRITYYDFGPYDAKEILIFLDICDKYELDYEVFGFEAMPAYAMALQTKFMSNPNVHIFNFAISDHNGSERLYMERSGHGNSIFDTKKNIDLNQFVDVPSILFSTWLKDYKLNISDTRNILRFNIEGAEWFLFNDLISNGLHKSIDLFCGAQEYDMLKVDLLKSKLKDYISLLDTNDIKVEPFHFFSTEEQFEKLIKPYLQKWYGI